MNKHELAEKLNNRQRTEEMTTLEEKQARVDGLVVVYGYSDDNVEFRGAWNEELGAYDGRTFKVNSKGLLVNKCDHDDCPYFIKELEEAKLWVSAEWNAGTGYLWFINSNIPFSPFDIMDDENKFCRGIVIDVNDFSGKMI